MRLTQERQAHFSPGYRGSFTPTEAVHDLDEIAGLAKLEDSLKIKARVYRRHADAHDALRLKLYILGDVMPLSASLPIFENLGLKVIAEDSFPVTLKTGDGWTHEASVLDFLMERADQVAADLGTIKQPLEDAFHAIIAGRAESDGFNRLVLGRRPRLARRHHPAHGREIPPPGRLRLQPGLCRAHAGAQSGPRRLAGRAVPRQERSGRCGESRRRRRCDRQADRRRAQRRAEPRRRPHHPPAAQCRRQRPADEFLSAQRIGRGHPPPAPEAPQNPMSRSSSTRRSSTSFPCPARMSRSSSMPPRSRACICASARWRAAASAGPTGARISAPRSWAW